jgi:Ca-activated chloride channel family protein
MRIVFLLASFAVLTAAQWGDPYATAREAERAFDKADFGAAAEKYNEALVDDPDSALLHFNLGASQYRAGNYEQAVSAYVGVTPSDASESSMTASTAYNIGNGFFRLGESMETEDPAKAIENYTAALVAYRRAMGADPTDPDPKFNHELAERKIAELREQQQQEQDEEQQQDSQDQQEQQKQQDEQEQQDPSQSGDPSEEASGAEQDQQQQADSEEPSEEEQSPSDGEPREDEESADPEGTPQKREAASESDDEASDSATAVDAEPRDGEMSEREAQAILDAARDQELQPGEIMRRLEGARVQEPQEDW